VQNFQTTAGRVTVLALDIM